MVMLLLNRKKENSVVTIKCQTNTGYDMGYGIVYKVSDKTYIVTNNHVVEDANEIIVNNKYVAHIVNRDEYEDIAVLTIDNTNFKTSRFNYNLKYQFSVKTIDNIKGKIIKKNYKLPVNLKSGNYLINTIKLNLNIKDGYSGSPLYNHQKEVIGMITLRDTNTNESYAIDIKHALYIAHILETINIKRSDLAVELASTSNKQVLTKYNLNNHNVDGVIVMKVYRSKKLKKGDIITHINNIRIKDIAHFKYYLYNNTDINLKVYRSHKYLNIKLNIK